MWFNSSLIFLESLCLLPLPVAISGPAFGFWLLPVHFAEAERSPPSEALGNEYLGGTNPTGHVYLKNGAWV